MFDQLPETISHRNSRKIEAFGAAFALQIALVAGFILLQMVMPEKLGNLRLLETLYMAPPPPPPAPVNAAPEPVRRTEPKPAVTPQPTTPVVTQPRPVETKPEIVEPTAIPKDIARIVESGPPTATPAPTGVSGGVKGGLPGGVLGGVSSGILGGAMAPPPPPPPKEPVRVGGNVKQPKVLHIEQPAYPPGAKQARIEGVVVVEATVTAEGNVEKVKVVSGPEMLAQAAIDAVSQWKYEPTYLNGQAVPVILTAKINFSLNAAQK
jgi:protein TonB